MKAEPSDAAVRVLREPQSLEFCGQEAAILGSRALVVSSGRPDGRQTRLLERVRGRLTEARVGQHAYSRVPRTGEPVAAARSQSSEAAREAHCSLVLGLGDDQVLDVARYAAGSAYLPALLIPTVLGYGRPVPSSICPFPDVLILDPEAVMGCEREVLAREGVALFAGILEAYAAQPPVAPPATDDALEAAFRALVEELPRALRASDAAAPRERLNEGIEGALGPLSRLGRAPTPLEEGVVRLTRRGTDPGALRCAVLPAMMEIAATRGAPLDPGRLARFGRQVLDIREADDGRAAQWAAGGVRQWVRSLGLETRFAPTGGRPSSGDETWQEILAAMRR